VAEESIPLIENGDYIHLIEKVIFPFKPKNNQLNYQFKVLIMSLPNTYIWLIIFYMVFHLFLNLQAEILRFGDR